MRRSQISLIWFALCFVLIAGLGMFGTVLLLGGGGAGFAG